jgi:hypothetical protein
LQVDIVGVNLVEFSFEQVAVGYVFLAGFVKDAPLGPLIIEVIDTVAIVTDEGVDMILAVDGDAHDFLWGVDIYLSVMDIIVYIDFFK